MTKRTGRPRGRPRTKTSSMLTVRVKRDLLLPLHAYRDMHRESLSAILREALRWWLHEGNPYAQLVIARETLLRTLVREHQTTVQETAAE